LRGDFRVEILGKTTSGSSAKKVWNMRWQGGARWLHPPLTDAARTAARDWRSVPQAVSGVSVFCRL